MKQKETDKCKHTPSPEGYLQWHSWAEKKAESHYQVKCPHCGLWAIWKRKATVKFSGGDLVVGRVLHEDDDFMTIELVKNDDKELNLEEGDLYFTLAFIKMDEGKPEVWKPWETDFDSE